MVEGKFNPAVIIISDTKELTYQTGRIAKCLKNEELTVQYLLKEEKEEDLDA